MTEPEELQDGDLCVVIAGTHTGRSGMVADIKSSKTGAVTITVVQDDGERFKTLARNASRLSAGGMSKA
ncbi:KOW motif-containing protein [Timonella senegalensis]|uniref:KOW motif-containing protein n=1 Tax=Timonella senegalensis TaxID=1465825 RepID=UPI0002DBC953|nr:KOW motif-containing protein [Timonella senegalensis]